MKVIRKHEYFYLCWQKYVQDLLEKVQLSEARFVPTPLSLGKTLTLQDVNMLDDPIQYRLVVHELQYCSLNRLEITFSINKLCQFLYA